MAKRDIRKLGGKAAGAALEKLPWSQGIDRYLDYYHTLLR